MDLRTANVLKRINSYFKIKKYLTRICYFLIASGALLYLFFAINKNGKSYKVISDYKENPEKFKMEKVMINPRIKFENNDKALYEIKAKSAVHADKNDVTLYEVSANGKIGNIVSGELKVSENGNHLIFTNNPVIILNKTKQNEQ